VDLFLEIICVFSAVIFLLKKQF